MASRTTAGRRQHAFENIPQAGVRSDRRGNRDTPPPSAIAPSRRRSDGAAPRAPEAGAMLGAPRIVLARAEARRYFELGYQAQMARRIDEAIDLYGKSIEAQPTAEAHTFLGVGPERPAAPGRGHRPLPDGDRAGPRLRQSVQRHRGLPHRAGATRRRHPLAGAGHASAALRTAPLSPPQPGPRAHPPERLHAAIGELKAVLDIEPGHAGAREQIRELHRRLAMLN